MSERDLDDSHSPTLASPAMPSAPLLDVDVTPLEADALLEWTPLTGQLLSRTGLRRGAQLRPALEDLPTDRLLIGMGFNSATGEKGGHVVEFDPAREADYLSTAVSRDPGQRVRFSLQHLTRLVQLTERTSTSVAANFGWGIFGGSAEYEFVRTGSFTQFSSYLFIEVRVQNATETLRVRRLSEDARDALNVGATRFLDFAGDQFVDGRISGGLFRAVVEFRSKSNTEAERSAGAVSAAVGGFLGGAAEFSRRLTALEELSDLRILLLRDGGIQAIPDLAGLRAAALEFPLTVARHPDAPADPPPGNGAPPAPPIMRAPVIWALTTAGFNTIGRLPRNFPSLGDIGAQTETLRVIAGMLVPCFQRRGDLAYIEANRDQFDPYSNDEFSEAWEQNEQNISLLVGAAAQVKEDPQKQAPRPPTAHAFRATRRNAPIVQPPPVAPGPQWVKLEPFDRTFVGRVPAGRLGAVTLRGVWEAIRVVPNPHPRRDCAYVTVSVNGPGSNPDPAYRRWAMIQILSPDGSRVLRQVLYTGEPVMVAEPDAQVYVVQVESSSGRPVRKPAGDRIERPDCNTAEALIAL